MKRFPMCPVRGHNHAVVHVKKHMQQGTGREADTWECPTGRYRWFLLRGHQLGEDGIRFTRPRWGWSKRNA